MAGSISLSLSQQFDTLGKPLSGGLLYFIQAGTTSTPQNAYKDTALTLPHPNPIILDAAGRVPAFYLADGQIKIRLTDSNGVPQIVQDNLLVIGPSSGGGGGGGSVDPTTILQTGWIVPIYGTGSVTGFVRGNGRTIGSATSGASERANSDTQALFIFLWNADPNLVVSTGRGASGLADFQANKTIALPDFRGRVLAGPDGMGNAAANRIPLFGANADVLGSPGGQQTSVLTTANLPPYTPAGSVIGSGTSNNIITNPNTIISIQGSGGASVLGIGWNTGGAIQSIGSAVSYSFSGTAQGGTSSPVSILQPMMLITIYVKL